MTDLLAVAMVAVVGYCLALSLRPSLRGPGHRADLDWWHVVMGSVMLVMLLSLGGRVFSVLSVCVFLGGVAFALLRTVRARGQGSTRAAYLRLGVGCAAMVVMLLPTAAATAASGEMGEMGEMGAMPGMDMADHGMPGQVVTSTAPLPVLLILLAAVAAIFVARLWHGVRRSRRTGERLDAFCEVAMAGAMAYMLLMMV